MIALRGISAVMSAVGKHQHSTQVQRSGSSLLHLVVIASASDASEQKSGTFESDSFPRSDGDDAAMDAIRVECVHSAVECGGRVRGVQEQRAAGDHDRRGGWERAPA
eukprot:1605777-Rhodomonas_salina.1